MTLGTVLAAAAGATIGAALAGWIAHRVNRTVRDTVDRHTRQINSIYGQIRYERDHR